MEGQNAVRNCDHGTRHEELAPDIERRPDAGFSRDLTRLGGISNFLHHGRQLVWNVEPVRHAQLFFVNSFAKCIKAECGTLAVDFNQLCDSTTTLPQLVRQQP